MHYTDLNRLREIAARPEETEQTALYAPLSDARMAQVARAIITHAEQFDLDGDGPHLPADSYVASFLTDVLHFADLLSPKRVDTSGPTPVVFHPGGARTSMEQAVSFLSDSSTPTYDNLKGVRV